MPSTIIGVAGGSGSGKSTLVRAMVRKLGDGAVSVIQHDSYYLDRGGISECDRQRINYDHPDGLETSLLVQHLCALKAGEPVEVPVYDFTEHRRRNETRTVVPRPVIIVEGILTLADVALRSMMDVKVFVDTDPDIRVIRRIERDMKVRSRTLDSVIEQYMQTVRPMHLEFVEPSKRYADLIVPDGGYNEVALNVLITKVKSIRATP